MVNYAFIKSMKLFQWKGVLVQGTDAKSSINLEDLIFADKIIKATDRLKKSPSVKDNKLSKIVTTMMNVVHQFVLIKIFPESFGSSVVELPLVAECSPGSIPGQCIMQISYHGSKGEANCCYGGESIYKYIFKEWYSNKINIYNNGSIEEVSFRRKIIIFCYISPRNHLKATVASVKIINKYQKW